MTTCGHMLSAKYAIGHCFHFPNRLNASTNLSLQPAPKLDNDINSLYLAPRFACFYAGVIGHYERLFYIIHSGDGVSKVVITYVTIR